MTTRSIVIRVQSGHLGQKRIECVPSTTLSELHEKVSGLFDLNMGEFTVSKSRSGGPPIGASRRNIEAAHLQHGDILYLITTPQINGSIAQSVYSSVEEPTIMGTVPLDAVDLELAKLDGKIEKKKDELHCRHGAGSKCFECMPLEPWDETYLASRQPPIKFLSFTAHMRKQLAGVSGGKFVQFEDISCTIKPGCTEHLPWPRGICTKCQPSAIVLSRQSYRHVDNVMFENHALVDKFLDYWRKTGSQRIGILIGKYEQHTDVPLGIRATVAAIYEPPQTSTADSVELLDDPNDVAMRALCSKLDVRPVGWIFTDLLASEGARGAVRNLRGVTSHFISAGECILAAHFQNAYPNPCKLSKTGVFGSKFVTVVATGDASCQIHFEAYQVTNQCQALVRDDCLVPTVDKPELGYVRDSSAQQYIPDVFYKKKDEYNNEVTELARPLPVEYLLIDLPTGFPLEERSTFSRDSFVAENRDQVSMPQSVSALRSHLDQFSRDALPIAMKDFHLLLYLATAEHLPVKSCFEDLLVAIRTQDAKFFSSPDWRTVEEIVAAVDAGSSGGDMWACPHCTFHNPSSTDTCGMCSLPKA